MVYIGTSIEYKITKIISELEIIQRECQLFLDVLNINLNMNNYFFVEEDYNKVKKVKIHLRDYTLILMELNLLNLQLQRNLDNFSNMFN